MTDQGPGIPPDMKDKVFDFIKTNSLRLAPPRRRERPLAGALISWSCTGGTVSINTVVGRGTTVTCIFPTEAIAQRSARRDAD